MKFVATLLGCLTVVTAQHVIIGSPPPQAHLTAGQNVTVDVILPDFQSSSSEVAVAIGIQSCADSPCNSPADTLGRILHKGEFTPQRDARFPSASPFQNFTVTIPDNLAKGNALLGVAHFSLIGAGAMPFMETLNSTVIIV